ncbi:MULTISPECIES: hypothetical protein [Pantoea]|uniref:hypothetical protein n=1 Tax=Pantoea TaxID=53335 RepID=UPI001FF0B168|nr:MULTISPECIES: hypothetical protein [Pantoea]MDJ0042564.1 hypothetical protein [Pantoea allii]
MMATATEILKELFSINGVFTAVIATIVAVAKKYMEFHRRDFFSRPSSTQIKAVRLLMKSAKPMPDPLIDAEQQLLLQSFGLLRNRELSIKIICLYAINPSELVPFLRAVLRYEGMYKVVDGKICPRKFHKWFLPLMGICLVLFNGFNILRSYQLHDDMQFYTSVVLSLASFSAWSWAAFCDWQISVASKKINEYSPPESYFTFVSEDFSSILNCSYPKPD